MTVSRGLVEAQGARFAGIDPLLPAVVAPPDGDVITAALPDGTRVAGVVQHQVHDRTSAARLWSASEVWELTPLLGGAGAAGMDALLRAWRQWLDRVGAAERDSACVVTWPSRDAEAGRALLDHGLVPLSVIAVRRTPPTGVNSPAVPRTPAAQVPPLAGALTARTPPGSPPHATRAAHTPPNPPPHTTRAAHTSDTSTYTSSDTSSAGSAPHPSSNGQAPGAPAARAPHPDQPAARGTRSGPPPPGMPTIRRATPADLDAVLTLALAELRYSALVGSTVDRPEAVGIKRRALAERLAAGGPAWLVERDGIAVALAECALVTSEPGNWTSTRLPTGRWGYVNCVSVLPGARGAGIGRHLMAYAHRELQRLGTVGSYLYYNPPNPLSSVFWPRQGYRPLWTVWEVRPASALR
ncbi:GNAT family N-acetyltransferase [Actinosynnema sp. NPDC050436]|uniref:GNAT family N-acetyltransferase n=1 Tax=Actinosynnema sp. NPDC050436 TaxID=3155659 RepID=UPI0033C61731